MEGGQGARDPFIDALRAFSVLVVVAWHWGFNQIVFGPDGPYATNPIGQLPLGWLLTWFLQILPVFFVVGGWSHRCAYRAGGRRPWRFVATRYRRLALPALVPLGIIVGLWAVVRLVAGPAPWLDGGLVLLVTPYWFLVVYLLLVPLVPLMDRLADRLGAGAPLVWAAGAVAVDVARFHFGMADSWALLNFVLVYAYAHQLGFGWDRLRAAPRRRALALSTAGVAGLVVLTQVGSYALAMVGYPGLPVSNMAPPTVPVLFLTLFQLGLVLAVRPWLEPRLTTSPPLVRASTWANGNAMAIYLFHVFGKALFLGLLVLVRFPLPETMDGTWWLEVPVQIAGSALCTWPLLRLSRRFLGGIG